MRWCVWCGEKLKMDSRQGWVHQDGAVYKPNGHCVMATPDRPTTAKVVSCVRQKLESLTAGVKVAEERDTKTIAGMFAEALGCLEDALCCLQHINNQYPEKADADDIRLLIASGLRACSPAMDFWLQTERAQDSIHRILRRLQRVEPLASKEEGAGV